MPTGSLFIIADILFGAQGAPSIGQECAHAILISAYGLVLVRVSGRRVFSKWSALDIIVTIVIGSNLSRAMTGNAPLFGTLAATTMLMAIHWAIARGAARAPWLSQLVEGRAIDLATGGRLTERTRRAHGVSDADLDEALRGAGVERVKDTRKITLEPSGRINVLKP